MPKIKLSATQIDVLRRMYEHDTPLKLGSNQILAPSIWVEADPTTKGIRYTTLKALRERGLIERQTPKKETTPWYRTDYILTPLGEAVAKEIIDGFM